MSLDQFQKEKAREAIARLRGFFFLLPFTREESDALEVVRLGLHRMIADENSELSKAASPVTDNPQEDAFHEKAERAAAPAPLNHNMPPAVSMKL